MSKYLNYSISDAVRLLSRHWAAPAAQPSPEDQPPTRGIPMPFSAGHLCSGLDCQNEVHLRSDDNSKPDAASEHYRQRPEDQPLPTPGRENIFPLVIADLEARQALGIKRYGQPLQTHNGRDALQDAYEEALDQVVYLKQAILERRDHEATERELKISMDDVARTQLELSFARQENGRLKWRIQRLEQQLIAVSRTHE